MAKQPWDYHDDFSFERLQLVAKLLRDTRLDALALHDPGAGDTAWSLGWAFGEAPTDLVWRIVVETNIAGEAEDIVLMGSNSEGEVDCTYVIPPLVESVKLFEPRRLQAQPGVELPAPVVTSRRDSVKKGEDGRGV